MFKWRGVRLNLVRAILAAPLFLGSPIVLAQQQSAQGGVQAGYVLVNQAAPPRPGFLDSVLPGARLAGLGELKFFGFKIYDAQLWMAQRVGASLPPDPTKILEQSFALDLRYARNLKGEEIAERSLSEMRRLGFGDEARQERWLADMKRIFPSVSRGDRITGLYQPGGATRFFFNEKAIGQIDEAEFGIAFFNIWFDPRTRAPALRDALMKAPH